MSRASGLRRPISFRELSEVLADAQRCVQAKAQTTGNWSLGQILEHLAIVIDKSIDGFGLKAPWFYRCIARWFLKGRILGKGMAPGLQLPKRAAGVLVPGPIAADAALGHLCQAFDRLARETKRAPHPVFGDLTILEWNQLHLRHAELHLSFVALV